MWSYKGIVHDKSGEFEYKWLVSVLSNHLRLVITSRPGFSSLCCVSLMSGRRIWTAVTVVPLCPLTQVACLRGSCAHGISSAQMVSTFFSCLSPMCPSLAVTCPSAFPRLHLSPSLAPPSPWQHWHHREVDTPTVVVAIQQWVTDAHLRTSLWKLHLRTWTAIGRNTKWVFSVCLQLESRRRAAFMLDWEENNDYLLWSVSLSVALIYPSLRAHDWKLTAINLYLFFRQRITTNWPVFGVCRGCV